MPILRSFADLTSWLLTSHGWQAFPTMNPHIAAAYATGVSILTEIFYCLQALLCIIRPFLRPPALPQVVLFNCNGWAEFIVFLVLQNWIPSFWSKQQNNSVISICIICIICIVMYCIYYTLLYNALYRNVLVNQHVVIYQMRSWKLKTSLNHCYPLILDACCNFECLLQLKTSLNRCYPLVLDACCNFGCVLLFWIRVGFWIPFNFGYVFGKGAVGIGNRTEYAFFSNIVVLL